MENRLVRRNNVSLILMLILALDVYFIWLYIQTLAPAEPNSGGGITPIPPVEDTFTTFLNAMSYDIGIDGTLTKTFVTDAISNIGAFTGVEIGTSVQAIGTLIDSIATAPFYNLPVLDDILFRTVSGTSLIGSNAFRNSGLNVIGLPPSLSQLGQAAFRNTSLESITIPDNLTYIPEDAFRDTSTLLTLTLHNGLSIIRDSAFRNTALNDVDLSNLVTIGNNSFEGTSNMTAALNLTSLTSLGTSAFKNSGVSTLNTGDILTIIPENAFYNSSGLGTLTLGSAILEIGISAFSGANLSTLSVPNSTLSIRESAFENNNLNSLITFGTGLIDIRSSSFLGNTPTTVVFDAGNARDVQTASNSFSSPNSLVYFSGAGPLDIPVEGRIFSILDDTLFVGAGGTSNVFIPGTLTTTIISSVETDITTITGVSLAPSVAYIANGVFQNSTDILDVDFRDTANLQGIGQQAFLTSSLTSFNFNEGLSIIQTSAFSSSDLTGTVSIPSTFNGDGTLQFYNCPNTRAVTVAEGAEIISESMFRQLAGPGITSFYPAVSLTTYRTFCFTSNGFLEQNLNIYENVHTLASNAFSSCALLGLSFPNGVSDNLTTIASECFEFCKISWLDLPAPIATLETQSFRSNTEMENLFLGTSITTIGNDAFENNPLVCLEWRAGNSRAVTIGTDAFTSPPSFLQFVGSTYNVPLAGKIFCLDDNTIFIGSGGTCDTYYTGELSEAQVDSVKITTTNIQTVQLGNDITEFGISSFANEAVQSIVLRFPAESLLTTYGTRSFEDASSLQTVPFIEGITTVDSQAFLNCTGLSGVIFPTTLTTLGTESFRNSGLSRINFPDNLDSIPAGAFRDCSSLVNIVYGSGVSIIGESAFKDSATTTGTIATVIGANAYENTPFFLVQFLQNSIGTSAFKNCTQIPEINLQGPILTVLEDSVFEGCTGVESLLIESPVVSIGNSTFLDCNIDGISIIDTLLTIGERAFENNGATLLTYGDNPVITEFGASSVKNNSLTTLSIPNSTLSIRESAFENNSLNSLITFGTSLIDIDSRAFLGNTPTTVVFDAGNARDVQTASNSFSSPNSLVYFSGAGPVVIPVEGRIFSIDDDTLFFGAGGTSNVFVPGILTTAIVTGVSTELTTITGVSLAPSVTVIGDSSFQNRTDILTVDFRNVDNLQAIEDEAFRGSTLVSFPLAGSGLSIIGDLAFFSSDLTGEVTIPSAFNGVGNSQFFTCQNITSVVVEEGVQILSDSMFRGSGSLSSLSLPTSITSFRDNCFTSCILNSNLNIYENIVGISSEAFKGNFNLPGLSFPNGVSNLLSIDVGAFETCAISWLDLPAPIATLGDNCFLNNTEMENIFIGSSMVTIGNNCFQNNNIECLEWRAGTSRAVTIGTNAFTSPPSFLQFVGSTYNVPLGGKIFCLDDNTIFVGSGGTCDTYYSGELTEARVDSVKVTTTNIQTVQLGNDITQFGISSFANEAVQSIVLRFPAESLLTTYGTRSFEDASSLQTVPFIEGITTVDSQSFLNCTGLSGVIFPTTLTTLGSESFRNTGLSTINFPNSLDSLGSGSFRDCGSLATVSYGSGVSIIRESSFKDCILYNSAFPSTVLNIGANAYENCTTFNQTLIYATSMGTSAFKNCTSLTSLLFLGVITSLEDSVYQGCTNLNSVTFPPSLLTIGVSAFSDCTIDSIGITANVTNIGESAFQNNGAVALGFAAGGGVVEFGMSSFKNNLISTLSIPNTTLSIRASAFEDNSLDNTITFGHSIATIESRAFLGNTPTTVYFDAGTDKLVDITSDAFSSPNTLVFASGAGPVSIPVEGRVFVDDFEGSTLFTSSTSTSEVLLIELTSTIVSNVTADIGPIIGVSLGLCCTYIGDNAFDTNTDIVNIGFKGSKQNLQGIGENAFENTGAIVFDMSNSGISIISANAFLLSGISQVVIPSGFDGTVGNVQFRESNLESVIFEEGVTRIAPNMFFRSAGLSGGGLSFSSTLTTGGFEAFRDCNIGNFDYPSTLTNPGIRGFRSSATTGVSFQPDFSLTTFPAQNTFDNNEISYLRIPDSVQTIPSNAFAFNTEMETLILGTSLTNVQNSAFQDNEIKYLEWVPGNARACTIGNNSITAPVSFFSQYNSSTYNVPLGGEIFRDTDSTLFYSSSGTSDFFVNGSLTAAVVSGISSDIGPIIGVSIGTFLTSIDVAAFQNSPSLTEFAVRNGATNNLSIIGDDSFRDATNLITFEAIDSVIEIGISAFANTNLNSLSIPNSTLSIRASGFENNSFNTLLTFGNSIVTIENNAFFGNNTSTIYFDAGNARNIDVATDSFSSPNSLVLACQSSPLVIPVEGRIFAVENYEQTLFTGSGGTSEFLITGELTEATVLAVEAELTTLTSVAFGNAVTYIGNDAFQNNTDITEFTFRESKLNLQGLGADAFKSTGNFVFDMSNSGISIIRQHAFQSSDIVNITVPSDFDSSIDNSQFRDSSLETVVLEEGVTSLTTSMFLQCSNLWSISIPSSLTTTGYQTFQQCGVSGIFEYPSTLTATGRRGFRINNISGISFQPDFANTSFGDRNSFSDNQISYLRVPDSVQTIPLDGFAGNTVMETLIIGTSTNSINTRAFNGNLISFLEWVPGYARSVNIQNDAITAPISFFSQYNNTTYDVPLDGQIFRDTDSTLFTGSTGVSDFPVNGALTAALVAGISASIGTITGVSIGNFVTSVGISAFQDNTTITEFLVRDGATNNLSIIEDDSFRGAINLATFEATESLIEIGVSAFSNAVIGSLSISDTTLSIRASAFENNGVGDLLTFGNSIVTIENNAFFNNNTLTVVFESGNARNIDVGTSSFSSPNSLVTAIQSSPLVIPVEGRTFVNNIPNVREQMLAFSPTGLWMLDETSGTTVIDSSANGNDGTYVGAPTLNQASLIPSGEGAAVDFTGLNYAEISTSLTLQPTTAYSMVVFLDSDTISNNNRIVQIGPNDYFLVLVNGSGNITIEHDSTDLTITSYPNATNIMLAITWDNVNIRCYINSVEVAVVADAGALTPNGGMFTLFAKTGGGGVGGWDGRGQMFGWWADRTLTPSEIQSVYNAGFQPTTLFTSSTGVSDYLVEGALTSALVSAISSDIGPITGVSIGSFLTSIDDAVFQNSTSLTEFLVRDGGNNNLSIVGLDTFRDAENLVSFEAFDSLELIGNSSFRGASIQTVSLPGTLLEVATASFRVGDVKSVVLANGVSLVGANAFNTNTGLTYAQMGASITQIDANAFNACPITSLVWDAGNARTVNLETGSFTAPASFTAFVTAGSYDVPIGGSVFI